MNAFLHQEDYFSVTRMKHCRPIPYVLARHSWYFLRVNMFHQSHFLLIALTCWFSLCYGQDPIKMTILSIKHFASEQNGGVIQCRMTTELSDEDEYNVESLRTGNTRAEGQIPDLNPDPPSPVYNDSDGHPYYRINMQNNNNDAFGVFGCKATKQGKDVTIISTTRMRSDADIVPTNGLFTQTVSVGDTNVSISMNITTENFNADELRWRNNTHLWNNSNHPSYGADTFSFEEPIELYHGGIYECHKDGDRSSAKHGLNLLIVRGCPHTTWGPPNCEGVCESCYNGGVCDEHTGKCVCAPGFNGTNCLIACNGNRYGYNCEQRCTYKEADPKGNCVGTLFCLVDPFGCRCNTGFKGLSCDEECNENTFGASCLESCHCVSDQCNQYTGECEGGDTSCDLGWTGEFCQECENGYFGTSCDQECHCSSDKCNRESGLCQGECLPQWADLFPPYSCQTGLVSATFTRVNAFVQVPVNCTTVIGPGGNFDDVNLVLSKSPDDLVDESITISNTHRIEDRVTRLFMVSRVDQDLSLYCQLRTITSTTKSVAVLAVTVSVYDRPMLSNPPTKGNVGVNSVEINWQAWNDNDMGDGPVVGYIPYYKGSGAWTPGVDGTPITGLNFVFDNLDSDTDYLFSVAAVREGEGGEGERSPSLQVTTLCPDPTDKPREVSTKIAGDKQQKVKLSWKNPANGEIGCRSGVEKFRIYYSLRPALSIQNKIFVEVNNPTARFHIINGLEVGKKYSFEMTLFTEGGESDRSNRVEHLVPVLPELSLPPSINKTTSTTISIKWKAWNETRDNGTPPVVSYTQYYKLSKQGEWEKADTYGHTEEQDEYYAKVETLNPDTMYDFRIAAVREGANGEGPPSPALTEQKTHCDVPNVSPNNVTATYTGENQELANITWQHTKPECSTGVEFYTVYTFHRGEEITRSVLDSSAKFSVVQGLSQGEIYNFKITLTTSGGESQLNDTGNNARLLLPELPMLFFPPYLIERNATSIRVGWTAWNEAIDTGTPPVVHYILYYKTSTASERKNGGTYYGNDDYVRYSATVKYLDPDTLYQFSVAAVREGPGGEGKVGPSFENRTICNVPTDGPKSVTANKFGDKEEEVEISWELPSVDAIRCSKGVEQFKIYYSSPPSEEAELNVFNSSATAYKIKDLEIGKEYTFEMTLLTEGGESSRSEKVQYFVPGRNVGAIVGSTITSFLFLLLLSAGIVFFLRKRRDKEGTFEDPKERISGVVNNAYADETLEPSSASKKFSDDEDEATYANVERPAPILLLNLENYVKTTSLEQQFLMFNKESQFAAEVGAKEENKTKNRFKNMIAYDHSRVVLPERDGDPHSDYYNANFIKNAKGERGFIASQGPNKASVDDFWRMIWLEKVSNIVMLTNCIERGKDRCIRYWPNSVGETTMFGTVKVKWLSTDEYANFDIREYNISYGKNSRSVRNWHFKTWPDKDIPDQPSPLIEFAKRVREHQKNVTGPLLVHCSAGVGRTGTFIALRSLIDVVETSEKIDVYGFIEQMRADRINMVQTPRQYKFLHECLLEVYLTRDTAILINELTTFNVNSQIDKLSREFKLLAKLDQMSSTAPVPALQELDKCRFPELIPLEKKRPYLQSLGKSSSGNYINACSVMSYRKESSVIATQSPLPSTIEDFWRLVYDWKCPLIVMLNQLDKKDETVCKYWPDEGSSDYGNITVELKEEQTETRYTSRIFEVDHAHMKKPSSVHHLQLKSWDENNLWDIYSFINEIRKLQQDYGMVEPIVIHCINGVGRTGVVIAVKSEIERMEAEEKVDVFTTVRQMRNSSHNLVQTQEEYTLCHQLLKLSSPEATYANI